LAKAGGVCRPPLFPFGQVSAFNPDELFHTGSLGSVEALVKFPPWQVSLRSSLMELGTVLQYLTLWLRLNADRRAVTALEYGLIAGVIVATIAVGFSLLANDLSQQFSDIGNSVTGEN
jgi:Flp pilus assembly pilin Flp